VTKGVTSGEVAERNSEKWGGCNVEGWGNKALESYYLTKYMTS